MKTIFQYYMVSYGTIKEKHAHHRVVFGQGRRKINLSKRSLEVGNDKVTSKNVEKPDIITMITTSLRQISSLF